MVLLPSGLTAKTKRLPIVSVTLIFVIGFVSLLHFRKVQQVEQVYWESPSRIQYAKAAQKYLKGHCLRQQARTFCQNLHKIPLQEYLAPHGFSFFLLQPTQAVESTHLIGYMSEELNPDRLAQQSPAVFRLYQQAEKDKKQIAAEMNFLSGRNRSAKATLLSLLTHRNLWHGLSFALIFLALSFPVEERLGGLLLFSFFLSCGWIGLMLQALLDPQSYLVIGAGAGTCGLAGLYLGLFWNLQCKFKLLLPKKTFYLPTLFYSLFLFTLATGIDFLFAIEGMTLIASFSSLLVGVLLGVGYRRVFSLPQYFVYPYEKDFQRRLETNLSQYDRVKVLAEWLYHCPQNLTAFQALANEVLRSSSNPKVNHVLNKFRQHAFPEVYRLNRWNLDFYKALPVRWLSWAPVGHSPQFMRKQAEKLADAREFEVAFKLYFLILNEVGWRNNDDAIEMFKNYKKASVSSHFSQETDVLKDRHSPFAGYIEKRKGFSVA